MFKLFRDSIFNPKNIIHYRAKKGGFVFLYMLILSLLLGFANIAPSINYKGLDYDQKVKISKAFKDTDARIEDGIFLSSTTIVLNVDNITIGFLSSYSDISEFGNNMPQYVVMYDKICIVTLSSNTNTITTISELSSDLRYVELYNLNEESEFFNIINDIVLSFKPFYLTILFIYGMISAFVDMLIYAAITYLFMTAIYRVGNYMKKGQLFKMLIFATTSVVIAEAILSLFNITGLFSFIIILASLVPLVLLEREIMKRIRMKILGEQMLNNQNIVDKVNDLIKKNKNNENDEIDYDADDDDNDNNE